MTGPVEEIALLEINASEYDALADAAWARGDYVVAWAMKQVADQSRMRLEFVKRQEGLA